MAFKISFCSTNRKTKPLVTQNPFLSKYTAPSRLLAFISLFTEESCWAEVTKGLPLLWLIRPIRTGYRKSRSHEALKALWTATGNRSRWSLASNSLQNTVLQKWFCPALQQCKQSLSFSFARPKTRETLLSWNHGLLHHVPVTCITKYPFSEAQPQKKNILSQSQFWIICLGET